MEWMKQKSYIKNYMVRQNQKKMQLKIIKNKKIKNVKQLNKMNKSIWLNNYQKQFQKNKQKKLLKDFQILMFKQNL